MRHAFGGGARGELGPSALTMGAELLEQVAGTGRLR
jgi:hypothetical protein